MDRRNFLKSISTLAAAAASVPTLAAITQPNKNVESIRLLDACRDIADTKEVSARVNKLFAYLRENFSTPVICDENILAYRKIMLSVTRDSADLEVIAGIRGIPPNVADDIYPIALCRLGFTVYNITVNPLIVDEFEWFKKAYGEIIIKSVNSDRFG
jgi:hypothetical protein